MTLDTWLEQFTAGAAQLPGWEIQDGFLRRVGLGSSSLCCPLMAQWNIEHLEQPATNNHPSWMRMLWKEELGHADIDAIMDAADRKKCAFFASGTHKALRAQLLAACGVEESADDAPA